MSRELTKPQKSKLEDAGYSVVDLSMISFVPQVFELPEQIDWIFFSSVKGVDYFLASTSMPRDVQIAAVGASTSDHLKKLGFHVGFIGSGGDVEKIGNEFNKIADKQKILMPGSAKSTGKLYHSIAKKNEVILVSVYDTIEYSMETEPCFVYVFTSPANVHAFFSKNQKSRSTYIAIGKSTWEALQSFGITAEIAEEPSIDGIITSLLP